MRLFEEVRKREEGVPDGEEEDDRGDMITVTAVSKGTLFCCSHPSSSSGGQDAVCYARLLSEVPAPRLSWTGLPFQLAQQRSQDLGQNAEQ